MKRVVICLLLLLIGISGVGMIYTNYHDKPKVIAPVEKQVHFSQNDIYIIRNLAFKLQLINQEYQINLNKPDTEKYLDIQMVALYDMYMNKAAMTNDYLQNVIKLDEEKITNILPIYLKVSKQIMINASSSSGIPDIIGGSYTYCLSKDKEAFVHQFDITHLGYHLKLAGDIFPFQFWIVEKTSSVTI
jgi:hypothetical protein